MYLLRMMKNCQGNQAHRDSLRNNMLESEKRELILRDRRAKGACNLKNKTARRELTFDG